MFPLTAEFCAILMSLSAVVLRQKLMYDIFYKRSLTATYGCGTWGLRFHLIILVLCIPFLVVIRLPEYEQVWWRTLNVYVSLTVLIVQVCGQERHRSCRSVCGC